MREIIAQNKGFIKSLIKKITGSYNEDIEQEVYIKTWKNLSNYQDVGKFKSWIATITSSVCKDYFKSSGYLQLSREITEEDILENQSVVASQEKVVEIKNRQKIILKAVDKLPSKMRKVIILYEFEEFTIEQIAQKLGEPIGTIKSRLYNARRILAEKLKFLQGDK